MTTQAATLMVRDLTAVLEDDLVLDAVHVLYSQRIPGVPVVRTDWTLVGFLAEGDILKAAVPTYLEVLTQTSFLEGSETSLLDKLRILGRKTVGEIMSPNPTAVEPTASLMTVADLMLRKRIKRLPVAEKGRLVGIIDRSAFCEYMMEASERDAFSDEHS